MRSVPLADEQTLAVLLVEEPERYAVSRSTCLLPEGCWAPAARRSEPIESECPAPSNQ